jgi:hypothetical protein
MSAQRGGRDPREEAERLVATALAALSVAANGTAGFATGSAECCVCPVCKAIAAARDPDPEFAERLATGVGDLAVGLAGVLRAFGNQAGGQPGNQAGSRPGSQPGGQPGSQAGRSRDTEEPDESRTPAAPGNAEDVWRHATTETPKSPKPMAKKAVKPKIDPEA